MTIKFKLLSVFAAVLFIGGFFVIAKPAFACTSFSFSVAAGAPTSSVTNTGCNPATYVITNPTPSGGSTLTVTSWGGNTAWMSVTAGTTTVTAGGSTTTYTVSITNTNLSPGTYQGIITVNGNSEDGSAASGSGQQLPVTLNVTTAGDPNGGPGSCTPSLVANPSSISSGSSSTLTWNAPGCDQSLTITNNSTGQNIVSQSSPSVSTTGSVGTGALSSTTSFTLTARSSVAGALDHTSVATVTVGGSGGTDTCAVGLTASPASITSGTSATLTWNASGCDQSLAITNNSTGQNLVSQTNPNVNTSGSVGTGALSSTTSFTLTARSGVAGAPAHSSTATVTVTTNPTGGQCQVVVSSTAASSSFSYTISGPSTISGSAGPGQTITYNNQAPGTYSASYTGGGGQYLGVNPPSGTCDNGTSINFQFSFSGGSGLCNVNVGASSAGYTGSGTVTYAVSGPTSYSGSVQPGGTSFTTQNLPQGTYTVSYTGGANSPPVSITPAATQTCSGGTISFTMNWSNGCTSNCQSSYCTVKVRHTGNPNPNYLYNFGTGDRDLNMGPFVNSNSWTFKYLGGNSYPPANPTIPVSCSANQVLTITWDFSPPPTGYCQIGDFEPADGVQASGGTVTWLTSQCTNFLSISGNSSRTQTFISPQSARDSGSYSMQNFQEGDSYLDLNGCGPLHCDTKSIRIYSNEYCNSDVDNCNVPTGVSACRLNSFNATAVNSTTYKLDWNTQNCDLILLTGGGFDPLGVGEPPFGNTNVSPPVTTHYCLSVYSNGFDSQSGNDMTVQMDGKCVVVTITQALAPAPATNVVAQNTNNNANIPCGQVNLSWTAGAGATSYNIYRSTDAGNPGSVWQTTSATSLTDSTGTPGTTYYYWVEATNANGAAAKAASNGVTPMGCLVNLSTSTKNVISINGQPYSFSSTCIPGQTGSINIIKKNDVARMEIAICNTGSAAANNVTVTDNFSGENLANLRNVSIVGGSAPSYSTNGTTTTFSLGTINAGFKATISFDADVTAPAGNNEPLLRFNNSANITYTSGATSTGVGCVGGSATNASPCPVKTGFIVFYNGLKAPVIKEVNP